MLDDTRGGLDASSLHRVTSKYKSLAKKVRLLSCHRDNLAKNLNYISSIHRFYFIFNQIKILTKTHEKIIIFYK